VIKPQKAELTDSGIFVRTLSPTEFQVQLGEHWIDVVYSEDSIGHLYTVLGLKTDRGYAPLRKKEDMDWLEKAVDSIARKNKIKDYQVRISI